MKKNGGEGKAKKDKGDVQVDPGFVYDGVRDPELKYQCEECLYGTNTPRSYHLHVKR